MEAVSKTRMVIHLKVARVYALNHDNSPKIERDVIKLTVGKSFNNFLNRMHLKGYYAAEPPQVVRVMKKTEKSKNWIESEKDIEKYQEIVDVAFNKNVVEKPIDYKAEYSKLLERVEALENKNENPE